MAILLILSLILGIILAVAAILISPQLIYICFDFKDEIIFMRQSNTNDINPYKVLFQSLGLLMLLLVLEVPVVLWLVSKLRTGIVVVVLALVGVVIGLFGRGWMIAEALSGIPSGSGFIIPALILSVGSLLVGLAVSISLATVATAGVTLLRFNAEIATLAVSGTVAGIGAIGGIINIYKEHNQSCFQSIVCHYDNIFCLSYRGTSRIHRAADSSRQYSVCKNSTNS